MQKRYITSCVSFDTPFGWFTLEATLKGLKRIEFGKFCDTSTDSEVLKKARDDIIDYLHNKNYSFAWDQLHRYVGVDKSRPYLDFSGLSLIQVKVLREVNKISYGKTISYKELARLAGTSPRACGRVLASNPLPIIIPCHRVICANGNLGGYSGGLTWKRNLLKLEQRVPIR